MKEYHYQIGGCLPEDAPTYAVRRADSELYAGLQGGEFCYVLNGRQMGKSSLLVRTLQKLTASGFACATIDISDIGNQQVSLDKWYGGVAYKLLSSFNLFDPLEFMNWWRDRALIPPVQRLSELIETQLLGRIAAQMVIFIDEIDSVLSLKEPLDDFFALIRACYNKRAIDDRYQRLTFALLGVATPGDLIADHTRTPFNIGRAIELNGFSLEDAQPLVKGLGEKVDNPPAVMAEILSRTGGQPFLTQKLCKLVAENGGNAEIVAKLVKEEIVENWEAQDEPAHLKTIRDRLLTQSEKASRLLGMYQQILQVGEIAADDSPEQRQLRLSGLVVKQEGKLRVYNRIYQEIFNLDWVEKALGELRPYGEALTAWLASDCQDRSRLLRGQALQEAQTWAAGKSLADRDYRFLAASGAAALVELRQKEEQSQAQIHRLCREKELLAQLNEEYALRKATEAQLRRERILKAKIITGAVGALMTVHAFLIGLFWVKPSVDRMNSQLNTLSLFSEALLEGDRQAEALVQSIKAAREMRRSVGVNPDSRMRVLLALQSAVYKGREADRQLGERQAFRKEKIVTAMSSDSGVELRSRDGKLSAVLKGHPSQVLDVSFSSNREAIATGSADGTARLWHRDGTLLSIFKHPSPVTSVSFSPDGQIIATASADGIVRIWHIDGRLVKKLPGHHREIEHVKFTGDGKMLVSTNKDGTGMLWNLDLEDLLKQGCAQLRDYFENNPQLSEGDRHLCDRIGV
ncbi:MAG: AAA-like domain-containing protein [Hormoscilla sp.]